MQLPGGSKMTHFYRYFDPLTYTKFNQTPTLLCDTLYKVVLVRDLGGGKATSAHNFQAGKQAAPQFPVSAGRGV